MAGSRTLLRHSSSPPNHNTNHHVAPMSRDDDLSEPQSHEWDNDYLDSLEVTHDDFLQQHVVVAQKNKPPGIPGRRLLRSLRNPRYRNHPSSLKKKSRGTTTSSDNASTSSSVVEDSARSVEGQVGGGAITVASNDDTVQVSNRKFKSFLKDSSSSSSDKKKPWKTLKRIITGSSSSSNSKLSSSDRTLATESPPSAASPFSLRERARSDGTGKFLFEEQQQPPPMGGGSILRRLESAPFMGGGKKNKRDHHHDEAEREDMEVLLKREQSLLDDAIRGRLDGMDVISLGSARLSSVPRINMDQDELDEPISYSLRTSSQTLVGDMIWLSAGNDYPEMVLEGFIPAGDDRWMVRVGAEREKPQQQRRRSNASKSSSASSSSPPSSKTKAVAVSSTDSSNASSALVTGVDACASELCGDVSSVVEESASSSQGSHTARSASKPVDTDAVSPDNSDDDITPVNVLMKTMWGNSPPPPTHMSRASTETSSTDDEDEHDVLQMASSLAVPIDIDEDTFIIDTAAHLQSVHDICAVPLRNGNYEDATSIFKKILKGLELKDAEDSSSSGTSRPHHLIGSTLHNMGIVQMWQGSYQDALDCFEQAVAAREKSLPKQHPDIAVSCMREGIAFFALESFDLAAYSFERALAMTKNDNATRAKLFNNLGVAHYQRQDLVEALKAFTSALEIQRVWLAGPVRRASIVFDVSITLTNMGKVYMDQKDYDTALYVYEEALLLQTTSFRKDHEVVLVSLGNLAYAKAKSADILKAIQTYKGLLRAQETKYGKESREAIETMGLLGLLHSRQGQYKDGLYCLNTVLKWQEGNLNPYNPAIRKTKSAIHKMERGLQKNKDSSAWI